MTMNAATAAAAISSPPTPMKMVDTKPRAAIAPSTARIGPMQHATQATAAIPRIDFAPTWMTRWRHSRRGSEQIGDDTGGEVRGPDLQRESRPRRR